MSGAQNENKMWWRRAICPQSRVKTLSVGTQGSECLPSPQFFSQCGVLKVGLGSFVLDFFLVEGKTVARALASGGWD